MTEIQRIQIEAALSHVAIAEKWLGRVPESSTRESFEMIRENLRSALAECSINDIIDSIIPLTDDDLAEIFDRR